MNLFFLYFLALAITIIIEFTIYWIIIRKKLLNLFFYSVLINSLTLPIANYGYSHIFNNFYLIEVLVIFAESVLIFLLVKQTYVRSLLISFIANFITAAMSFFILF